MPTIADLFNVYGLIGHDKQQCLAAAVAEHPTCARRGGRLVFGDDLFFSIEAVGSQSDWDHTWLWIWANPHANSWSPAASLRIYDYGLAHDVPELCEAKFLLGDFDGHALAKIAVGILDADCYYRHPYQDANHSGARGAMFLVIPSAPEVRAQANHSAVYVMGRINEFIAQYDCNHRVAAEHYLRFKGYTFASSGRELTASSAVGESLTILFNTDGLILEISAIVAGSGGGAATAKGDPTC